jgi:hypothetical protein
VKISRTVSGLLFPIVLCVAFVLTNVVSAAHTPAADDTNVGGVLVGPCGLPGAEGPTGVNDDFTNRSINAVIVNASPEGVTTAAGAVVFRNMVQNIGTGDDAFVITVPSAPPGFRIEISLDEGLSYTALDLLNTNVTVPVAHGAAAIFFMRITAPAGLKVLTGFDTVIRAMSTITPTVTNDTIDRLYTGFIRLEKTVTVNNSTGAGGPTDAVSGAEIEIAIKYSNVSTAVGIGSSLLTAHNLVINEDGKARPNNWAATTDHVTGASDTQAGIIIGDREGSSSLSDIITTLEAGQSGVFKFKRRIK